MSTPGWVITALFVADFGIRIGLSVRVIMRRRPVGVSLAWLVVILLFPFAGAFIYLLLGELRLGRRRVATLRDFEKSIERRVAALGEDFSVDWPVGEANGRSLARLSENAAGMPALPGNELELISHWDQVFERIVADIDAAEHSCDMEFYIWHLGGMADEVAEALIRASRRGVRCRVLLDAVGSKRFLTSRSALLLRESGIDLQSALSGSLFHMLVKRFDLRMHRKIVVIDGEIAYTGSLNIVDPRYFKQESDFGQWVDAMVRMRGPAVEPMAITFLGDWALERNEGGEAPLTGGDVGPRKAAGASTVQVVPTGPAMEGDAIQILLMSIYAARRTLSITTPYFVPEEAVLTALVSAARRGVDVTLILPARVDSLLVRLASQPHMGELLNSGVNIMLFGGGLLHTKSVIVDGEICLFGSLNLDPRSIYLNFEITLNVYDRPFTEELSSLHDAYISDSVPMRLEDWKKRSRAKRFIDNVARLLSPLL